MKTTRDALDRARTRYLDAYDAFHGSTEPTPDQWDELHTANYEYEAALRARADDFTLDEEN